MDNCSAIDISVINYTSRQYPGEARYLRTLDSEDYAKIVFIALVMLGTILGNISVIVVVALNRSMHTTINIYVANLAVADLLVCAICMSSILSEKLHTDHVYILGPAMCKAVHFFQMTFLTSSVLTLSAIACDRFIAILFPFRVRITKQRTKFVLAAVWMVSIGVSIPLLFIRKYRTILWANFVQPNCGDQWPKARNEETGRCEVMLWVPRFYYAFVTISLFFLPAIIMIVTYSLILRRLSVSVPGEAVEGNRNAQDRSRKKVIKMVFTVLLVFVFCWMPMQLTILYDKFRTVYGSLPSWYNEVASFMDFLAYSNSFMNPIIYGGFNKTFRDNLCLLIRCKRQRRRFGTPQILQRFRLTLTTALSSSSTTRKTNESRVSRKPAVACENEVIRVPNEEVAVACGNEAIRVVNEAAAVPEACAEERVAAREHNKEGKSTPV